MHIAENVPLSQFSTMRLGGKARYMTDVHQESELTEAITWAKQHKLKTVMIGDGSNIIWRDAGFDGLVIVNKIMGFTTRKEDDYLHLTIGAGENWDDVVDRCVELGYSGIEQLSLIPGSAGATPVQNVGAYGREIKDVLISVEAYDKKTEKMVTLKASECEFAYRSSRFKTHDKGRFFITAITLKLTQTNPKPPFYDSLQKYLTEHGIESFTPQVIRDAVISIRSSKMPNPADVANNGSFFANPIVSHQDFIKLRSKFPDIPNWPTTGGRVKLSAAWLVEQSGFPKGHKDEETGMATWHSQALVLINEKARSTADLVKFKHKVVSAVQQKFGIKLEQEPELI